MKKIVVIVSNHCTLHLTHTIFINTTKCYHPKSKLKFDVKVCDYKSATEKPHFTLFILATQCTKKVYKIE